MFFSRLSVGAFALAIASTPLSAATISDTMVAAFNANSTNSIATSYLRTRGNPVIIGSNTEEFAQDEALLSVGQELRLNKSGANGNFTEGVVKADGDLGAAASFRNNTLFGLANGSADVRHFDIIRIGEDNPDTFNAGVSLSLEGTLSNSGSGSATLDAFSNLFDITSFSGPLLERFQVSSGLLGSVLIPTDDVFSLPGRQRLRLGTSVARSQSESGVFGFADDETIIDSSGAVFDVNRSVSDTFTLKAGHDYLLYSFLFADSNAERPSFAEALNSSAFRFSEPSLFNYQTASGLDYAATTVPLSPVPLPATAPLLLMALFGAGAAFSRRRFARIG